MSRKIWILIGSVVAVFVFALVFGYVIFFSSPKWSGQPERFIVGMDFTNEQVISKLKNDGFIKNKSAFNLILSLYGVSKIKPGGYKISKGMNAFSIASILSGKSYMKWVVIPEGLRKEEIADLFVDNLGWTKAEREEFINKDTTTKPDYIEGVYFPDTYLISIDETPAEVAQRLVSNFQTKFAPYLKEANLQNIRWTTVLKLASIIQREAGSKSDMPIISGIFWNRLDKGMRLEVDSTLQYARGDKGRGYWSPISVADKKIDSPYNTYLNKGLPPAPIANPGIDAINAVLKPVKTDCLYYLHDSSKQIHCSVTYAEHQKNIALYLK